MLLMPQIIGRARTGIVPVTTGKTIDATWDTYSVDYADAVNLTAMWMRAYCGLSSTDSGVIVSSGGVGLGMALYAYDGSLYFQCGNGHDYGDDVDRGEVSWVISSTDPVIEVYADTSGCELYIDGILVDSQTYSVAQISGADEGQLGGYLDTVDLAMPTTRLGNGYVEHPYTGSIEKVEFFDLAY